MKRQVGSHLPGKVGLSASGTGSFSRSSLDDSLHSSNAPGRSSDPESHPLTQLSLTPPSQGYRLLGEFIIPGKMSVSVSSGHQADLAPQILFRALYYANTVHISVSGLMKRCSLPQQGEETVWDEKTFLWGVGRRRGCATGDK